MNTLNTLGSTILNLRKKSDITQDQLAEQLGVSVSAVSQWENGRTMPDISAIPVLCHIFNVSSDELLGIDREKDEEEIKRINDEANRLLDRAHTAKAEKLLLDAHKRFPNNYNLMSSLMHLYFGLTNEYEYDGSEQGKKRVVKNLQKSIDYAQKILDGCRDEELRAAANQILCFAYNNIGENEKAIEIAKKMPTISVCREGLLSIVSKDHAKYESKQHEYFMLLQKELTHTTPTKKLPLPKRSLIFWMFCLKIKTSDSSMIACREQIFTLQGLLPVMIRTKQKPCHTLKHQLHTQKHFCSMTKIKNTLLCSFAMQNTVLLGQVQKKIRPPFCWMS